MQKLAVLILMLFGLAACGGTPAEPSITPSPVETATISSAELTAAVRFRPTLPPTFTPTSTMTATYTPTLTFTPTITLTPSPLPESMLCEQFAVAIDQPDGAVYRLRPVALQLYVESRNVSIRFTVTDAETGGDVLQFARPGGRLHLEVLLPFEFPREGSYRWRAVLFDAERDNLCPVSGMFIIDKTAPSATPESTAEATAEITAEATEE